MAGEPVIKELDTLLKKHLGDNKIIKDVKSSRLTAPGENYGSVMTKLDIVLYNKTGNKEENVYLVAKTLPETEMWREIFNVQQTYNQEMGFYDEIVPTLQEFQRELGINDVISCFPKCYGTRRNLKPNSNIIDDDAVLILENLHYAGFENADRIKGADFETSLLILKNLALMHGVTLALKIKKPEVFEEKVKKHCKPFSFKGNPEMDSFCSALMNLCVLSNSETAKFASKIYLWGSPATPAPVRGREPFATCVHQDLWLNNTLQKYKDGKAVDSILVDFQGIDYASPASDVFFFLWSSVSPPVFDKNLDFFLKYYHDTLINILKQHGCDVTLFSYENFLKEMEIVTEYELSHSLFFHLLVLNAKKGGHEVTTSNKPTPQEFINDLPQEVKEKAWFMIKECHKRGWLK